MNSIDQIKLAECVGSLVSGGDVVVDTNAVLLRDGVWRCGYPVSELAAVIFGDGGS